MKVSIVIPNYNGEALLAANLPAVIAAKNHAENNISEIVVVDDGSVDRSVAFLKENFPEVVVIKHKVNRGFPAAVNTGVRGAKGDLIALLNTDVIPEKDFLVPVLPHFDDHAVFAVSLHEKGYGPARGIFKNGFIAHEPGKEAEAAQRTFWVSGGSGVFRRSIWMLLGGLDEKLFSPYYWEDVDIGYRAIKRGFKLLWEPKAVVIHHHGSTTSKISASFRSRIQERNQLLLTWKNITSIRLTRKHMIGLIRRCIKHPGYLRIVLMALSKLPAVLRARRKEAKESRVSDEAVFAGF